jgi:hypothetical protein
MGNDALVPIVPALPASSKAVAWLGKTLKILVLVDRSRCEAL